MNKQPMTATITATSGPDITKLGNELKPGLEIKPPFKLERVLAYIVEHGSINRLEAEKAPVFDHALNSTMSNEIKLRLGLEFSSIPEKTTGYNGLGAIFNRYSFTPESNAKAKKLINDYRIKRGAFPIQWEGAA